jgi:hypothetical protein
MRQNTNTQCPMIVCQLKVSALAEKTNSLTLGCQAVVSIF